MRTSVCTRSCWTHKAEAAIRHGYAGRQDVESNMMGERRSVYSSVFAVLLKVFSGEAETCGAITTQGSCGMQRLQDGRVRRNELPKGRRPRVGRTE